MSLRTDDRQWTIYDPHTIDMVFQAMQAAALVQFGAWLEQKAGSLPTVLKDNIGTIGTVLSEIGELRQQVNAGLRRNDVPDELVAAQRGWNRFAVWLRDPSAVPMNEVVDVIDQIAAAMAYLNERAHDTGTFHPGWPAKLVTGLPCETCGR